MANHWKLSGVPHKGWEIIDVVDVKVGAKAGEESVYETCMMCGKEKIRFVQIVQHKKFEEIFRVGCKCAEKMTNDYHTPKKRERELKNRAARRSNWEKKQWNKSQNGNLYIRIEGRHMVIFKDAKTQKFKVKIGSRFGEKSFETLPKAKMAAFEGMEYFRKRGEW